MGASHGCAAAASPDRGACLMAFPSPSLPAPSLVPYQFEFKGLPFGGFAEDSPYQLIKIPKGVDGMTIVGGDVQRALDQGEQIGLDLEAGRDVELELIVRATEAVTLDAARQALGGVLGQADGVKEEPLYLELPSGIYAVMARPRKYSCPIDLVTVQAQGTVAIAMLHATDPRWYAAPTKEASTGLPGAVSGGMTFPAIFPVVFGGSAGAGTLDVYNNGTTEMRPVLVITGPVTRPSITNSSIVGDPTLTFDIELEAEDTLEIDTDFETVLYTPVGAPFGADRRNTLVPGSTWWNLPPGLNVINWKAVEGGEAALLTVQSADAYAAI